MPKSIERTRSRSTAMQARRSPSGREELAFAERRASVPTSRWGAQPCRRALPGGRRASMVDVRLAAPARRGDAEMVVASTPAAPDRPATRAPTTLAGSIRLTLPSRIEDRLRDAGLASASWLSSDAAADARTLPRPSAAVSLPRLWDGAGARNSIDAWKISGRKRQPEAWLIASQCMNPGAERRRFGGDLEDVSARQKKCPGQASRSCRWHLAPRVANGGGVFPAGTVWERAPSGSRGRVLAALPKPAGFLSAPRLRGEKLPPRQVLDQRCPRRSLECCDNGCQAAGERFGCWAPRFPGWSRGLCAAAIVVPAVEGVAVREGGAGGYLRRLRRREHRLVAAEDENRG